MNQEEHKQHFNNPAWVTYLSPFTLIVPDNEEVLTVELEKINSNTYDHGKLCTIVTSYRVETFSYKLLICYDGALAIPKIGNFSEKEKAVDLFNNILCKLLLGGFNCEGIDRRDIVNGQLYNKRMIWPVDFGHSASTHIHSKLRMRVGGNFDSIILSKPNSITVSEFHEYMQHGAKILSLIGNLTPKFLVRGITEIKYRNWDLVLSNLWITVEQLIDFIWNTQFLTSESHQPRQIIEGRLNSLKEDNRTWSASVKQEILFQAGIIDEKVISKLFPARQARNKLVHDGKSVPENAALGLFEAVQLLLGQAVNQNSQMLVKLKYDIRGSKIEIPDFSKDYFDDWASLP